MATKKTKKKETKIVRNSAELKWLMLTVKLGELVDRTYETMEDLEKKGEGNGLMYQMCNASMATIEYVVDVMHSLELMERDGGLNIHYADKDGKELSEEVAEKGMGKA